MKPEGVILIFIFLLILMCIGYLGYLIYLRLILNKEGYDPNENLTQQFNRFKGITNICSPYDADYNSPECIDISFADYDNTVRSAKAILDPGYGVDPNTGFVTYIGNEPPKAIYTNRPMISNPPAGFQFQTDYTIDPNDSPNKNKKKQTIPTLGPFTPSIDGKNDQNNIDIQYHADPSQLTNAQDDLIGYSLVKNDKGEVVPIPYSELKGQTVYNQPGTSRFGPSSYVPNYEETVFLSKLTNEIPFLPVKKQESGSYGFCQQNANVSLDTIEKKCGTLDNETCASTECCVLFGGAKCVAGNERGPSIQSNYSDFLVKNRDYYYYKGKCYGNCKQSYGIKNTTGYGTENLYATYSPSVIVTNPPTSTPKLSNPWNWNNWMVNNKKWQDTLNPPTTSKPVDTYSLTYTDYTPLPTDAVQDVSTTSTTIPANTTANPTPTPT